MRWVETGSKYSTTGSKYLYTKLCAFIAINAHSLVYKYLEPVVLYLEPVSTHLMQGVLYSVP